jgi:membrane-associated phospholipid phosphatase
MRKRIQKRINKISEAIALLSVELVIVFVAFFVSIALLIVVIRSIFFIEKFDLDQKAFDYLLPFVSETNTAVIQFFTVFGSHKFLVPAYFIFFAWFFFVKKNKWYFIKFATIAVSNLLLMFGLKYMFNRPRPLIPLLKQVPGLSFPSGHAYMSFTFFGLLIYLIYREVKNVWVKWISIILLLGMIFFVGLSRIYLRVHYISDVLAGYCFGLLSLVIMLWLLHQIEKYNKKKLAAAVNITPDPNDPVPDKP